MSLRTDIDEPTAPGPCEPTSTGWRDVLVVGAHHEDASEGQFLERHRSEAGCSGRIAGRFDVANAITVDQIRELPREEITQRILSLPQVSRMRGA